MTPRRCCRGAPLAARAALARPVLVAGVTVAVVALRAGARRRCASVRSRPRRLDLSAAGRQRPSRPVFGGSNLEVSGPTRAHDRGAAPGRRAVGTDGVWWSADGGGGARDPRAERHGTPRAVPADACGRGLHRGHRGGDRPAAGAGGPRRQRRRGRQGLAAAADAVSTFAGNPSLGSIAIALGVAAIMLVGARVRPGVPFSLLGVAAAAVLVHLTSLQTPTCSGGSRRAPRPSFGFIDPGTLSAMLPSALAIAALAALESLLSATVADGMSVSHTTDPDRELFGQGLANLAAPVFGGVPATGAIARRGQRARGSVVAGLVGSRACGGPGGDRVQCRVAGGGDTPCRTGWRAVRHRRADDSERVLLALIRSTRGDAAVLALTFASPCS